MQAPPGPFLDVRGGHCHVLGNPIVPSVLGQEPPEHNLGGIVPGIPLSFQVTLAMWCPKCPTVVNLLL